MIVLDTDALSHLRTGSPAGEAIDAALTAATDQDQRNAVISAVEMLRGQLAVIEKQERSPSSALPRYGYFAETLDFLLRWRAAGLILPYDEAAERVYRGFPPALRRELGRDARIAAIALDLGAVVWTLNVADYRRVPGLSVVRADTGAAVSGPA